MTVHYYILNRFCHVMGIVAAGEVLVLPYSICLAWLFVAICTVQLYVYKNLLSSMVRFCGASASLAPVKRFTNM